MPVFYLSNVSRKPCAPQAEDVVFKPFEWYNKQNMNLPFENKKRRRPSMNTYESANIRRWFLIILNIVFFFGVFWPLFSTGGQAITAWTIRQRLRVQYSGIGLGAVFGFGVSATVCFLFVLLCPVLHFFKLLGFFGEARRNSHGWSLLFSILELIGVVGLPIICIVRYSMSVMRVRENRIEKAT